MLGSKFSNGATRPALFSSSATAPTRFEAPQGRVRLPDPSARADIADLAYPHLQQEGRAGARTFTEGKGLVSDYSSPESRAAGSHSPLVTVVIPARNEEDFIGPCLESVLAQSETSLEVLVVNGASEDRTEGIIKEYVAQDSRVQLLHNPAGSISRSLNLALIGARGRWLVRVDAHSIIPPDYIASLVNHLATGRWGGVGGRKDGVGKTPAGRAIAVAMASRFGGGNSVYHYGTMAQTVDHIPFGAYPTALARRLSGWDERFPVNQDYEFDYRVRKSGRELLFDPAIRIDWHCRQTISDLFRQYRRYGRDKARIALLVTESLNLRHLVPPSFVAVVALAILGGPRYPQVTVGVLAPYILTVVGISAAKSNSLEQPKEKLGLLAAFPAMHLGWGLGFWEGLVRDFTHRSTTLQRPVLADQSVIGGPAGPSVTC